MFRLVELIELDLRHGGKLRTFRLEIFQDNDKSSVFRARLWEIEIATIQTTAASIHFTGPLMSAEKMLTEKSMLLPTRYASPFSATDPKTAAAQVVRDFSLLFEATRNL